MFLRRKEKFGGRTLEYMIVGLGNPGRRYENTRHNAGFLCVDRLAEECKARVSKLKFKALYGDCTLAGVRCVLCKPQDFMNCSGEPVSKLAQFYKIPLSRVIVLFDDVSLEPGRIRIREKGSDGGHNGMKDIIAVTGENAIARIKIGVGAKPHPDYDLADWVLSSFRKEETAPLTAALENAIEALKLMVQGELATAMNRYNGT